MSGVEPIEDARGNCVWPGAWVAPGATLGRNNRILPNAVLGPRVTLGDGNWLHPYAVVGSASQARKKDHLGRVEVGDRCEFHPFSGVNESSSASGLTKIGDDVIVMQGGHVGHDCVVGDRVVLSNHIALAGHVTVDADAVIGALALVAQHLRIGKRAHVLPHAAARRDVWPFETFDGRLSRPTKVNVRAVRRLGGSIRDLRALRAWFGGMSVEDIKLDELIPDVSRVMKAFLPSGYPSGG